ncbi:hypothetical protein Q8G81_35455, partial [Klebsiella pneumoniae]
MTRAIEAFTEAVRFGIVVEADPGFYPKMQYNLGLAYVDMRTGDRAANLARAIDCFTEALRFCTAAADPANY